MCEGYRALEVQCPVKQYLAGNYCPVNRCGRVLRGHCDGRPRWTIEYGRVKQRLGGAQRKQLLCMLCLGDAEHIGNQTEISNIVAGPCAAAQQAIIVCEQLDECVERGRSRCPPRATLK